MMMFGGTRCCQVGQANISASLRCNTTFVQHMAVHGTTAHHRTQHDRPQHTKRHHTVAHRCNSSQYVVTSQCRSLQGKHLSYISIDLLLHTSPHIPQYATTYSTSTPRPALRCCIRCRR